jgi:hypothetical protein
MPRLSLSPYLLSSRRSLREPRTGKLPLKKNTLKTREIELTLLWKALPLLPPPPTPQALEALTPPIQLQTP